MEIWLIHMSTINLYSTEMLKAAAYRNSMLHSVISDRNHPVYNSVNSLGFDTNAWLFIVFFLRHGMLKLP